jgi:hypothetical protein
MTVLKPLPLSSDGRAGGLYSKKDRKKVNKFKSPGRKSSRSRRRSNSRSQTSIKKRSMKSRTMRGGGTKEDLLIQEKLPSIALFNEGICKTFLDLIPEFSSLRGTEVPNVVWFKYVGIETKKFSLLGPKINCLQFNLFQNVLQKTRTMYDMYGQSMGEKILSNGYDIVSDYYFEFDQNGITQNVFHVNKFKLVTKQVKDSYEIINHITKQKLLIPEISQFLLVKPISFEILNEKLLEESDERIQFDFETKESEKQQIVLQQKAVEQSRLLSEKRIKEAERKKLLLDFRQEAKSLMNWSNEVSIINNEYKQDILLANQNKDRKQFDLKKKLKENILNLDSSFTEEELNYLDSINEFDKS